MSVLSGITKGKQDKPFKIAAYSAEGTGKTTFAASAPNCIIIDVEGGSSFVDCARSPRMDSLKEVLAFLDALATEKHEFLTVAIDTFDALEPMIYKSVIEEANNPKIKSIEDFGYGKGYVAAADKVRLVLAALDRLQAKGMNVIVLAHATVKNFKSPDITVDAYDRFEMKLYKSTAALIKEWPDALLYGAYEVATAEKDGKTKGVSTGKRIFHTTHSAAWDAKNRYGLPPVIALSWPDFEKAARASSAQTVEKVKEEIAALLKTKDVRTVEKATEALARAGDDIGKLTKLAAWVKDQH